MEIYYFAYGSNADPRRFHDRVGPWLSRRPAWLEGYRLRFADSVQSEGGGGAVVDPEPGSTVAGVLFEITAEQLAAMDREEFDPERNTSDVGGRETLSVRTADGPVTAELYTVRDGGGWRAPSERYLRHILDGLEAAGHADDVLDEVRRTAASDGR
jgi:cation transport regulator ChaC